MKVKKDTSAYSRFLNIDTCSNSDLIIVTVHKIKMSEREKKEEEKIQANCFLFTTLVNAIFYTVRQINIYSLAV